MHICSIPLESADFKHVKKKDKSNLTLMCGKIMHHILHAIIFFLGFHLIHAFVTSIQVHLYVHTIGQCRRKNYCAWVLHQPRKRPFVIYMSTNGWSIFTVTMVTKDEHTKLWIWKAELDDEIARIADAAQPAPLPAADPDQPDNECTECFCKLCCTHEDNRHVVAYCKWTPT